MNEKHNRHIITLEDQSFSIEIISVQLLNVKSEMTQVHLTMDYVRRQDPDVILIGEMRDAETIDTALEAAETGHLVMSTAHS